MEQRPKTVPIVAAFLFAATAIATVVGTSLLFPNRLLDRLWELNKPGAALFHAIGRISGVFLLLLGLGTAAAGRGLLRRKQWAWWFSVVMFSIDGLGDVMSVFVTGDFWKAASGVAISSAFIYFLTLRTVREHFKVKHP